MKRFSSRGIVGLALLTLVAGASRSFGDSGLARHRKMYVVPAPGKVTIDGKLDDWDLSGQIETYVESETEDTQSGKFALMYDAKNLYISGVVRDNTPMLNHNDPKAEGDRGWNADSCQLRIMLDPRQAYPLAIGYGHGEMSNPDVTHLTMWYYTDKQEAELQMLKTMHLSSARPEWEPYGVVPSNLFRGKYVKMADGLGYTFEYAIPWSTLGAKAPLQANDMVAGTMQYNFSDSTGLKTNGGAWAYDVMSRPGFPYQETSCWGKLFFSAKGHVDRALVEEGLPPARELPLKFRYNLPRDGQVTLQIEDKNHTVQRILVAEGTRSAGINTELWDGLDSQGAPLLAGQYTVRGLYHSPITQKVLFSPDDSGQPPYKTDDGTGAWGGDEGDPRAVVAIDGGVLISWTAAEAGSGIIRTDLDGHKKWGNLHCASYLASDGKRLFTAGDMGFDQSPGVVVLSAEDGRQMAFGGGQSNLLPPAGGAGDANTVTGLAYRGGTVYVSYGGRNLIAMYDADSGAAKGTMNIERPGQLASAADSLLAVRGGLLVKINDGAVTPFINDHLDDPRGIAVGQDGAIYVANGGALQNVSVFDAKGTYLRSIGKAGGRPAVGHYDSGGMLEPDGIAIDKNGHLWVTEMLDSPRRVSEWDAATGALVNEFFGGCSYFGYSYINPRHPDEIYCHNALWKIDWNNNTCTPVSTIWRATTPNSMFASGVDGYEGHPVFFTAKNGHDYQFAGTNGITGWVVARRDGDIYKPFAGTVRINRHFQQPAFAFLTPDKYPDGDYFWQDKNDDQLVQPDELTPIASGAISGLDGDLNLFMGDKKLVPLSIEANGRPVYDPTKLVKTVGYSNEEDGSVYGRASKYSADGKVMWQFPNILEWPNALSKPMQAPGRLWGLTNYLGNAGDLTGWSDYFGTYHIFTRDGVYVGMLMRDSRDGKGIGADVTASETLTGQLVQPDGMNGRTFLLAGASDARVTEIFGLNDIQRMPDSTLNFSEADVQAANKALANYNSQVAHSKRLSIARGLDGLAAAEPITRQSEGGRSFKVRAAYDADNLYIDYDVTSPNKLVNSQQAAQLIFKGGNVLDIQIAANSNADPKRTTPAPGDVRILVTRQNDKPFAVLYQPKVKGFTGTPIVLSSPTGKESFDSIAVTDKVGLQYTPTAEGYSAIVTIPRNLLGLTLTPGMQLKMDVGVIYGNETGNTESSRSYWANNSFNANVTYDVPDESRLEPAEWGTATVE